MPRFYFDFHDGANLMPDELGSELSSLEAAEHEATQTILQLGRHWLPEARELSIAVRDEQHRPVLTLTLALTAKGLAPRCDWA